MVSVGYTGEREQEDGKTETNSTATTKGSSHVMPGMTLGAHESTQYRVSLFNQKLTDITVHVVSRMDFEDGASALMAPQPVTVTGVVTMSSMASFNKQVKGIKGCSAILAPAKEPTKKPSQIQR